MLWLYLSKKLYGICFCIDLWISPVQVDETLDLFNELQLQHQAVTTKTKTLHDACDRLVLFSLSFMQPNDLFVSLEVLYAISSYLL